MENEWAALVQDGLQVEGRITFMFDTESNIPHQIRTSYASDGPFRPRAEKFQNVEGQRFDRVKLPER